MGGATTIGFYSRPVCIWPKIETESVSATNHCNTFYICISSATLENNGSLKADANEEYWWLAQEGGTAATILSKADVSISLVNGSTGNPFIETKPLCDAGGGGGNIKPVRCSTKSEIIDDAATAGENNRWWWLEIGEVAAETIGRPKVGFDVRYKLSTIDWGKPTAATAAAAAALAWKWPHIEGGSEACCWFNVSKWVNDDCTQVCCCGWWRCWFRLLIIAEWQQWTFGSKMSKTIDYK